MGLKSQHYQKTHQRPHLPNFNFLTQFNREIGEKQHLFQDQQEKTSISPLLIHPRARFLDVILQLWIIYRLVQIGTIFAFLASQYLLHQIWAQLNFDLK